MRRRVGRHTRTEPAPLAAARRAVEQLAHLTNERGHDIAPLLAGRLVELEVTVVAHEIHLEAVEVVVLAKLLDERELVRPHLRNGPVQHVLLPSRRVRPNAILRMLDVELAGPDGTAVFRIGIFQMMPVVHPQRNERHLPALPASLDEHLHHVAAREHVFAETVRIEPGALLEPTVMLLRRIHLALPPRNPADARLEQVRVHARARHFVHRRLQLCRAERLSLLVPRADARHYVRRVVAEEHAERRFASRDCGGNDFRPARSQRRACRRLEKLSPIHRPLL